jgi:hypothetical protein
VLQEDTEPLAVMVDLARRYPDAKIIFSGGTSRSVAGPSEAATVKGYFFSFGIDPDRILTEGQSQTTEENAIFTDHLLRPMPSSGWLLVTSAHHMPRAMGAFRKAGFNVSAFPVGFRTHGWRNMWKPETIAADNLRRVDVALHEWIGLIEYKLKGYSDQWFPAPTGEEERVTAQFQNRSPSDEIGIARAPRISELVGRSFFPGPLAGSPSGRNDFSVALVQLLVNDPMSVGLFLVLVS